MLRLSFSSYASLRGHDPQAGRAAVGRALQFFRVAAAIDWFAVSDDRHQFNFALAFVVVESHETVVEYNVVVRGTNPLSLESWFREDFDVGIQVPWPGSPEGGKISQATATALALHEGLRDGNISLYAYLADHLHEDELAGRTSIVRFTGHSLGGLMAPVLALRFTDAYPRTNAEIQVYSFAAPTAGDAKFAAFLERSFLDKARQNFTAARFIRCRDDVAVKVWNKRDMLTILGLYARFGVPINLFLVTVLAAVRWSVRHHGYTQPFSTASPQGAFRIAANDLFALDAFEAEAYVGELKAQFHRAKAIAKRRTTLRVFRNTLAWVVQAVVMHVVPYAIHLLTEQEQEYVAGTILRTILTHDTLFIERRENPDLRTYRPSRRRWPSSG